MSRAADVLVVGARCAGAALAAYLARAGVRVVVVDRDPLHTDQVLSTHQIHPPGTAVLDELGVGDAMRAGAPGAAVFRLAKEDAAADIRLPEGLAEHCPRRHRLDGLLQDAAIGAGAEIRERVRVTEVLTEKGRARGVRLASRAGEEVVRADLVIGADGRRSTVARSVGAEEYLGYDAPRAMYWGYFRAPAAWHDPAAFPFGMYVGHRGGRVRTIFQTDDDLLLIGSLPTVADARAWRAAPETELLADLRRDPAIAPLVEAAGRPVEPVRGTWKERYFFRRGAGPGWMLVGDAGHHKEFVIGDGITEALLQARSAAAAILEGGEPARERWWRARDVEAMPLFFLGRQEGAASPLRELQLVVMRHVAAREDLRRRMYRTIAHEIPADRTFSPLQILGWALAEALRGRPRVLGDFLAMARENAAIARELGRRRRLLKAVAA